MAVGSASNAHRTLSTQLDRVEAGEEVAITRHGRVVAVLVRPDVVRSRRAAKAWERADAIGAMLEKARNEPLVPADLLPGWVEELVQAIYADRHAR